MARTYIRHPIIPTKWGINCLRARLSLGETQTEFAKRFMVQLCTVNNWETGKTKDVNAIHARILSTLIERLKKDGMYMPEPEITTVVRQRLERKGAVGY